METFLVSFLVFALAIAGMALGVLFGRPPIAGSCGGVASAPGDRAGCTTCACGHSGAVAGEPLGGMTGDRWRGARTPSAPRQEGRP